MDNLKAFIKSYWEYFLEIEEQFLESKKFVAFDNVNSKTFSIEYLKLYQAVCSEINVLFINNRTRKFRVCCTFVWLCFLNLLWKI